MGQCNFLHLWHQKLYRAFRFGTLWLISCSYPRHSQLTTHSLMLANRRIRQSLTALVLNENLPISVKISLKFLPKDPINNIPLLVHLMVLYQPGDQPLSEPMMLNLPMHMCVTQPQWINGIWRCVPFYIGVNMINELVGVVCAFVFVKTLNVPEMKYVVVNYHQRLIHKNWFRSLISIQALALEIE